MKYNMVCMRYRVEVAEKDSEGVWRRFATIKKDTEEDAVSIAQEHYRQGRRVKIEVISHLEGWTE